MNHGKILFQNPSEIGNSSKRVNFAHPIFSSECTKCCFLYLVLQHVYTRAFGTYICLFVGVIVLFFMPLRAGATNGTRSNFRGTAGVVSRPADNERDCFSSAGAHEKDTPGGDARGDDNISYGKHKALVGLPLPFPPLFSAHPTRPTRLPVQRCTRVVPLSAVGGRKEPRNGKAAFLPYYI